MVKKEEEASEMTQKIEWAVVLTECSNNVQKKIKPFLGTLGRQEINLGVGAGGDPIKEIDLAAENAIVDALKRNKIEFTLISEESGIVDCSRTAPQCYVTVDPIDGTTNLIRGAPFYATSIAVSSEPTLSSVYAGLVTDLAHGTTYVAQKGCGACCNGEKIRPSQNESVEESVLGIDLNSFRVHRLVPRLMALMSTAKHIRHFGANALELCYVADGTIDAFIDIRGKLRTTDIAAGWLIINEAGGTISTSEGKPLDAKLDPKERVEFIAAANSKIHLRILELITAEKETE